MKEKRQKGQSIITLLIFVLMGITITTFATLIIATNSLSTAKLQQGIIARQLADSGAENALINLLRNDNYPGEQFNIGDDMVVATVSGTTTKIIRSQGKSGDFIRVVEVYATYVNNKLTITSWKEIY